MFGMLEVAVIGTDFEKRNSGGHLIDKGESIKSFLEKYLPTDLKEDIAKRYTVDESFKSDEKLESFSKVIDHLWKEIRSGFVHEAGIESKGLEWSKFGGGRGTREDPIRIRSDVPMQELLQMTWQAILNSLGYKGLLKLPKYKRL
jgi:hypothetical protein